MGIIVNAVKDVDINIQGNHNNRIGCNGTRGFYQVELTQMTKRLAESGGWNLDYGLKRCSILGETRNLSAVSVVSTIEWGKGKSSK